MERPASLARNPALDTWLSLEVHGRVLLRTGKVELGQRLHRALRMIAAAELGLHPSCLQVTEVSSDGGPDEGYTVGSNSLESTGEAVRAACATARTTLLACAAVRLGATADTLCIKPDGGISHQDDDTGITLWDLLPEGRFPRDAMVEWTADYTPPAPPPASDPGSYDQRRLALGQYEYVQDLRLPGMLHARVIRPPHLHALLETTDGAAAELAAARGVDFVRKGSFFAVYGEEEFVVVRAASYLARKLQWRRIRPAPGGDFADLLRSGARVSLPVVDGIPVDETVPALGDPPAEASLTVSLDFEKPYLLHGSLGPSAAAAWMMGDELRVWSHTQGVRPLRLALAGALGIEPARVQVTHVRGPGCYGHNGADDAALDAALVAAHCPGRPVLLKWTRDDEHGWEPCGPAMLMALRASLDTAGQIIEWSHESMSDGHIMRAFPQLADQGASRLLAWRFLEPGRSAPSPVPIRAHHAGIHRNLEPGYDFGSLRTVKTLVRDLPLRTSSLRSLGAAGNVLAIEGMMEELAEQSGQDPLAFRLRHMADARGKVTLEALAARLPRRMVSANGSSAWGIGYARYKNEKAWCAIGAELELADDTSLRLRSAVIVADCGHAVDPQAVSAQLEGGFFQAASWALLEELRYDEDGVVTRDWESYPVLRLGDACRVQTHLIGRPGERWLGVGEASCGPGLAAIVNAASRLLQFRFTRLPLTPDNIRQALLTAP